jgi:hypothetical protein
MGPSDRGARPLQDDDATIPRVHPALPDPRAVEELHRIRHYGLLANGNRAENIAHATCDSRWLAAGRAQARIHPSIRNRSHRQSCPEPYAPPVHPSNYASVSRQNDRSGCGDRTSCCLTPPPIPHSACGTRCPRHRRRSPPRFRALALFGRRRPSAWMGSSSRRPKTCTISDKGRLH